MPPGSRALISGLWQFPQGSGYRVSGLGFRATNAICSIWDDTSVGSVDSAGSATASAIWMSSVSVVGTSA